MRRPHVLDMAECAVYMAARADDLKAPRELKAQQERVDQPTGVPAASGNGCRSFAEASTEKSGSVAQFATGATARTLN